MRAIYLFLMMFFVLGLTASAQTITTRQSYSSPSKWKTVEIGGVEYVSLVELCQFYRFTKLKTTRRAGYQSYGAKNRFISLRAGRSDFYVNNYRYILSYNIREWNGELMVSTIDVRKLIDPVLRPKYSSSGRVTTIIIDPGHGDHDAGAVSPYATEKRCNLELALKLAKLLKARGYKVVMTRQTDVFLSLQQRVDIANRYKNAIFISIHHNSANSKAEGIETFTLAPVGTSSPYARTRVNQELSGNEQDSENIALATAIHSRSIQASGSVDRGIQRARFSVLCGIKCPAILFEGGFVSNPKEGKLISSDEHQHKLARAIYEGIIAYCGIVGGGAKRSSTRSSSSNVPTGIRPSRGSINGNNNYTGTTKLR